MEWFLKAFKNYAGFQGRARRKEYWMFFLFSTIFSIVAAILDSIVNLNSILAGLYSLAILLPSLAVGCRRLHDTGRSGWWLLISLIPLIGSIILIVFLCQDSDEYDNKYGANPKM
ncbi:DUF805 domain-containing protein [Paenibacillus sp. FSL H8-0034]|uniref:DUF805 domain-containing protein n=1 Tax=Paenibacillus sp. FSL H8-0034 TaxID=2954671 RepID=UPI0030F99CEC